MDGSSGSSIKNMTIKGRFSSLSTTGSGNDTNNDSVLYFSGLVVNDINLDNLKITRGSNGISINSQSANNFSIKNSIITENEGNGVRIASNVSYMDGMKISWCTISNNNRCAISSNPSGSYRPYCTNYIIENTTIDNNNILTVNNSHDLSIFGFNGNLRLKDITIKCNHLSNKQKNGSSLTSGGWGLIIYGSNANGIYPSGNINLTNVVMSGTVIKSGFGIDRYSSVALSVYAFSLKNLKVNGANQSWYQLNIGTPTGSINLKNTQFTTLVNNNVGNIYAQQCLIFDVNNGSYLDKSIPSQLEQINFQIFDKNDMASLGTVVLDYNYFISAEEFKGVHPLDLEEQYGLTGNDLKVTVLIENLDKFSKIANSSFSKFEITKNIELEESTILTSTKPKIIVGQNVIISSKNNI